MPASPSLRPDRTRLRADLRVEADAVIFDDHEDIVRAAI